MDGHHDPSSTEVYNMLRERARQPAKGVIQGPLQEWRPSRRTLRPPEERAKGDYIVHVGGAPRAGDAALERGGDGTRTKFTKGFQRRTGVGLEQAAAREQTHLQREARHAAHSEARGRALAAASQRNGFNVVTGAYDASKLREARGRTFLDHKPTPGLAKEGERLMRDSGMRFFRVSAAPRAADQERAKRLGSSGLPDAPRKSSVLGYGRGDIESHGVRDALDKSEYEPAGRLRARREQALAAEAEAQRRMRASAPATDGLDARAPVRLRPGERAPDRVFGEANARLAPAMADEEKKMIRLDREISRAVGPRPTDRPASLLTNAARLEYERERQKLAAEIGLVRSLR